MHQSLAFCRRSLLISAGLVAAAAVVVALGVIPAVRADTFLGATPDRAVPAFWVNVVFSLAIAAVLAFMAPRTVARTRRSTTVLGVLGFVAFLLGFTLSDAALAFGSHGPAMRTATILLVICTVADLLAAVLTVTVAVVFPKST